MSTTNSNPMSYRLRLAQNGGAEFTFDCAAGSDAEAKALAEKMHTGCTIVSYQPFEQSDSSLPEDSWLRALASDDEVWWHDPHAGISSGIYRIDSINSETGKIEGVDTVVILSNAAGSHSEVFAAELAPAQPEDLFPVIDGDDGNGDIYGYATSKEDAIDVGNATFADEVVDAYLAESVTLRDGSTVAKAWVATTSMVSVRLRLTLDVCYALNGEPIQDMVTRLTNAAERAVGDGMLTGESAAEVDEYSLAVTEVPEPPGEEELAGFMLQRIEDGELGVEDIPLRLARYGLMENHAFVAEMRERMDNAANGG